MCLSWMRRSRQRGRGWVTVRAVQRDALSRELDRVGVTQLVRCEPTSHAGLGGESAQLDTIAGA